MAENHMILNRLFTQRCMSNILFGKSDLTYKAIINEYIGNPIGKDNKALIGEIYKFMSKQYRNEYFYKNTLLNTLLLGKHSINTTTALTEIPIQQSIADFVLINGTAVVYEIKTELDSFNRLGKQLNDYYRAFNRVCVVTSEKQFTAASEILKNTPVGIYVLTKRNTISRDMVKEPIENNENLNHKAIFEVLRKNEFEKIIIDYFGRLPQTTQAFHYTECFKVFMKIPIQQAYLVALKELKKRSTISKDTISKIPLELRFLVYFSRSLQKKDKDISDFLNTKYGG